MMKNSYVFFVSCFLFVFYDVAFGQNLKQKDMCLTFLTSEADTLILFYDSIEIYKKDLEISACFAELRRLGGASSMKIRRCLPYMGVPVVVDSSDSVIYSKYVLNDILGRIAHLKQYFSILEDTTSTDIKVPVGSFLEDVFILHTNRKPSLTELGLDGGFCGYVIIDTARFISITDSCASAFTKDSFFYLADATHHKIVLDQLYDDRTLLTEYFSSSIYKRVSLFNLILSHLSYSDLLLEVLINDINTLCKTNKMSIDRKKLKKDKEYLKQLISTWRIAIKNLNRD